LHRCGLLWVRQLLGQRGTKHACAVGVFTSDRYAFEEKFKPQLRQATRAFEGQVAALQADGHLTPAGLRDRTIKAAEKTLGVLGELRRKTAQDETAIESAINTKVYAGNGRELSQEEIAARQFIWTRAAAMSAQERTSLDQNASASGRRGDSTRL
jgi:hypothetical protein